MSNSFQQPNGIAVPTFPNDPPFPSGDSEQNQIDALKIQVTNLSNLNYVRQNDKIYSVGDFAFTPALPSFQLTCVKAGRSALVEPIWGTVLQGTMLNDGDVIWIADAKNDGNLVGDLVFRPYLRQGYVKLNGGVLARSAYPRLVDLATNYNLFYDDGTRLITGTTTSGNATLSSISALDIAKLSVGMLISGTGIQVGTTIVSLSTTSLVMSLTANASGVQAVSFGNGANFTGLFGGYADPINIILPNMYGNFIEAGDYGTEGAHIKEGLPNITGSLGYPRSYYLDRTGAFGNSVQYNTDNAASGLSTDNDNIHVLFDASLSSKIYGNSTTVQPPATVLIPQIKY